MRIRKNAKLSPLFFSNDGGSVPLQNFQTPVCQLNQSPWDVIPFDSYSPQFEGEDSFTGNGSPGDSIGAVESVASMMDAEDKSQPKLADMVVDDDNGIGGNGKQAKLLDDNGIAFDKAEQKTTSCSRCKNHEAKQGRSFCEHNLSLIRSYNSGSNSYTTPSSKKAAAAAAAAAAGARRARARTAKKAPSANPYEFYYYSGFGPLWGKRRGDRNGGGNKNHEAKGGENSTITEATTENATPTTAPTIQSSPCDSSSQIDNEGFDYDDDEEEEEEDDEEEEEGNGEGGKKRMRKPVKARSLKSLM